MELKLLDKNFEMCGLVDDWESLIWNRKYYDCGNFKLQVNIRFMDQFQHAKYIYCTDEREIGVIEAFDYVDNAGIISLNFSGRFLESVIASRVIDTTHTYSNKTTETICRELITALIIESETGRKINNFVLKENKNLGEKRTMQVTGGNLLDEIYELCKEDEISVMVNYDFNTKQYVCEFWQGLDRTDSQKDNTWAIFSKNFENILNDEYNYDTTQYCNYAYVAGEEDESKRTIVTVDRVLEGEERKELYVDARDLQSDEDTSGEEYKEMLIERGIEKLNSNNKVETSDFTIDSLSNLEYKKDFDLGDKIVYKNDTLGMIIENRIVAITESYENGTRTLDVTFGNDYNIKKIKEAIQ